MAGGVCVVAAVALISAGQPSQSHEIASVGAPYESEIQLRERVPIDRGPGVQTVAGPAASAAPAGQMPGVERGTSQAAAVVPTKLPAVASTAAPAPAVPVPLNQRAAELPKRAAIPPTPEPAAAAPTAAVPAVAPAEPDAAVTITGCLVSEHQAFWLKGTDGAEAPKARSWRSGFLRKRAASIQLVDAPAALKLSSHAGQRVAVTGTLVDREMRPRSLQRIAASCS